VIADLKISLCDLVMALSDTMDLVSTTLSGHHRQVAYVALSICKELGIPDNERNTVAFAAALHDAGALSVQERLNAMEFEVVQPHAHAQNGYLLLRSFAPLTEAADIIRLHHVRWDERLDSKVVEAAGGHVPLGSLIVHIADRISVLVNRRKEILSQSGSIKDQIVRESGAMFMPDLVDAFVALAKREYFWLDLSSPNIASVVTKRLHRAGIDLNTDTLLGLTDIFRRIIDFRSRFTATHSAGVAAVAEALANRIGFSKRECLHMRVAGYLHDLGKLAIPSELLEKPGKLDPEEMNVMRSHTFHTYRTLEAIPQLSTIAEWAAFHHERMNGTGYPFRLSAEDLPIGSRIMAVADVLTALMEDRPYREGMPPKQAEKVIRDMADAQALDSDVVSELFRDLEPINQARIAAQSTSTMEYDSFSPTPSDQWSVASA
jgi:HD-GYP domain-containing protein (c-di-GMP phosphodiesterase class II)